MSDRRRDAVISVGLGLAALALYLATMARTVYWYDSAEYVTAAVVLGIPHPPGYPLYTLIGHAFTWLPFDPAFSMNLMSAVFAAVAVALAYRVTRRLGARRFGAALGAAALATSELFWSQALIAEVYTPGLAFLFAALLLVLRGLDEDRGALLGAGAALAGLGLGVHLSLATCGLGLGFLVLTLGVRVEGARDLRRLLAPPWARRLRVTAACAAATVAGASIFLYVYLRARAKPALSFGDPSTWDRFVAVVTGGNYKRWFADDLDLAARGRQLAGIFYDQFLVVGFVLAALGLVELLRRRAHLALGLALMIAGNVWFFFDYQVHDLAVFFLPAIGLGFCLAGAGADLLVRAVETRRARAAALAKALLLLVPLGAAAANTSKVDLSGYREPLEHGLALAEELPEGAVVLNFTTPPEWAVDGVFTHYLQKVRRLRPDVRVIPVPPDLEVAFVLRLLRDGVPVYLFAPVKIVDELFEVRAERHAYRVVRFRPPR